MKIKLVLQNILYKNIRREMAPIVKDFPTKIITELKIKCTLLLLIFYMEEKKLPSLKWLFVLLIWLNPTLVEYKVGQLAASRVACPRRAAVRDIS